MVAYERITSVNGDYDWEAVKQGLGDLLNRDYACSIYGSTVPSSSRHSSSNSNFISTNVIIAERVHAAAELAAKEVKYEMLLEEEKQRKNLEAQKVELEKL